MMHSSTEAVAVAMIIRMKAEHEDWHAIWMLSAWGGLIVRAPDTIVSSAPPTLLQCLPALLGPE
jgi:hypothetical protein